MFVVFVLLAILTTLLAGNAVALRQVKQELRLIEQRQLTRLGELPPAAANAPDGLAGVAGKESSSTPRRPPAAAEP